MVDTTSLPSLNALQCATRVSWGVIYGETQESSVYTLHDISGRVFQRGPRHYSFGCIVRTLGQELGHEAAQVSSCYMLLRRHSVLTRNVQNSTVFRSLLLRR